MVLYDFRKAEKLQFSDKVWPLYLNSIGVTSLNWRMAVQQSVNIVSEGHSFKASRNILSSVKPEYLNALAT